MKVVDIIFALICGRIVGFLVSDFLKAWGITIGFYYLLLLWIVLPFFTLFCLWLAYHAGKKWLMIFQAAKFLLVGAVATVIDLKLFEWISWLFGIFTPTLFIIPKVISFLMATLAKYWGNKYWTFQKHEKEQIYQEILQFFFITLVGLLIDTATFYYFVKIIGPRPGITAIVWIKLSVVFAGIAAALWNFLGYKFLVFRK